MKDAHILIREDKVRTKFNDLLRQSREERHKMTDINAQLSKLQQTSLQQFGLTKRISASPKGMAQLHSRRANEV